jgi:hypothetical protein
LFLALRWNNYDLPLVRDEGEYAYAARLLRHGLAPYDHAFLQKPPMIVYTYLLADLLALPWFPRALAALSVAASTVLLGFIARLEFGPGFAWPAMWLFTPLVLLPAVQQFTANIEMFMLLPLLALVALCVRRSRHRVGPASWMLAGALAAVALWYKYTALPIIVTVFAGWTIREWQTGTKASLLSKRWLAAALGACLASAAALAFFLAHDGARRLWECTISFNRFYTASSTFGWSSLWFCVKLFFHDWWILFVLPGTLLVPPLYRISFCAALFLAAWLSTGASIYGHYYILVTPFWAVLNAAAIHRLASLLSVRLNRKSPPASARSRLCSETTLRPALTAAVLLLICLPDLPWVARTKQQFATARLGPEHPLLEATALAGRIAALTSPQDPVFVAGSEPQILYYAQRFSPTRFVITYPLMIPSPLAEIYQQEATRELQQHLPSVVVLVRVNSSWLIQPGSPPQFLEFLQQLLAQNYQPVGAYFFDDDTARWREPVTQADLAKAGVVLFKRKPAEG